METELELRKRKLDNLKSFIMSNLAYTRYLESFGEINEIAEEYCNLNNLKLTYTAFLLLLWKDEYIKKDENKNISGILENDKVDTIINQVATKNPDNTWNNGNIKLNSNYEVIDKIRNKLAHGDYIIDNNEIEIEVEEHKGKINIDNLSKVAVDLGSYWEQIKPCGENIYGIVKGDQKMLDRISHIDNKKDLRKVLENMYYVEIKDKPIILHQRNNDYRGALDQFKKYVMNIYTPNMDDDFFPRLCKASLSKCGIDISMKKTKATDLQEIDKIYNMYGKVQSEFNKLNKDQQIHNLGYWVHELAKEDMTKKNVGYGLIGNLTYLKDLSVNPNQDVETIINNDPNTSTALSQLLTKTMISAYLTNFYAIYIYGLDQIYANDKREHIEELFNNQMFDYSKLDLSQLKINKIDIEKQFPEFNEQILKISKDAIDYDRKVDYIMENAKKLSEHLKENPDEKKQEVLNQQYKLSRELLHKSVECEQLGEKCQKFMEDDFDTYKYNRSVIEHIRNSLAHGNVKINSFPTDGTIGDTTIEFKDIYQGKETFVMNTTVNEFLTIFNQDNLDKVYNYINTNSNKCNKIYEKK